MTSGGVLSKFPFVCFNSGFPWYILQFLEHGLHADDDGGDNDANDDDEDDDGQHWPPPPPLRGIRMQMRCVPADPDFSFSPKPGKKLGCITGAGASLNGAKHEY